MGHQVVALGTLSSALTALWLVSQGNSCCSAGYTCALVILQFIPQPGNWESLRMVTKLETGLPENYSNLLLLLKLSKKVSCPTVIPVSNDILFRQP